MRTATVTTVLSAPRAAVFDYLADIEHLPEWATEFARELRRDGDDYKVVNGLGEFFFAIEADRASGVIDIMPDTLFESQYASLQRELANLERLLSG